jgi:enamine deaminase RidA (YjgF/YER057c/UK114 family)
MSDEGAGGPWRAIDPPDLAAPVGYANAIESRAGRRICVAGQIDMARDGTVAHPGDLVAQVRGAFSNLAAVLAAANARAEHVVRMRIYVLDVSDYKRHGKEIGGIYREHFGRWFPAMTLVQIAAFYDENALVEIEAEAVVPD